MFNWLDKEKEKYSVGTVYMDRMGYFVRVEVKNGSRRYNKIHRLPYGLLNSKEYYELVDLIREHINP